MKLIERKIIIRQNALIKKGRGMFLSAIKEQYKQAMAIIHGSNLHQIEENIISAVKEDPVKRAFEAYYPMASIFGILWCNEINKRKAEDDVIYETTFKKRLRDYAVMEAGSRIARITETTESMIIGSVRASMEKGMSEGLGVEKIKNLILDNLAAEGETMADYRARLIAQTEMITASNVAAYEGATSTGLELRKFWSTSGLPNIRDSHLEAEADSLSVGGYGQDEPFSNGLQFPGDPEGGPDEVCNCRCSCLYEVVN